MGEGGWGLEPGREKGIFWRERESRDGVPEREQIKSSEAENYNLFFICAPLAMGFL